MKKTILVLSVMTFVLSACTVRDEFARMDGRIDSIESGAAINIGQLTGDTQDALDGIRGISGKLDAYISEVRTALSGLEATESDDYLKLQTVLDGVESRSSSLTAYVLELQTIISELESGRPWMDEVDFLLERIFEAKDEIRLIQSEINDNILPSIETLGVGIANLEGKTGDLEEGLAACVADIARVESELKEMLSSSVQSIAVVPEYADGSVKIENRPDNVFRFELRPNAVAQSLAEIGPDAFSMTAALSLTKAAGEICDLPISSVSYNETTGLLDFTVSGEDEKLKDFYKGKEGANARLLVCTRDGNIEKASDYFPLFNSSLITDFSLQLSPEVPLLYGKTARISICNIRPSVATEEIGWTLDSDVVFISAEEDRSYIELSVKPEFRGSASVVVKAASSAVSRTCTVQLYSPESIEVSYEGVSGDIKVGDEGVFKAAVSPSPGESHPSYPYYSGVDWTSSDTDIIEVSQSGGFVVKAVGTVEITATSKINADVSGTLELKVYAKTGGDDYSDQDPFSGEWE